jgi:sRNA-binding regulator protein Hfq
MAYNPRNIQPERKNSPPIDTFAEIFYYKKQIDSRTEMVIVLRDGEEIRGTIEWYDRHTLKINRDKKPNILLMRNNIKYMYKAED